MQYSDLPNRVTVPFAESGPKNTVPVPSQVSITPGAASFTTGFPPLTMTPIAAGGVPPFGQDMNGILFDESSWTRWVSAGGMVEYDATFSTAVGGYPKGAILKPTSGTGLWMSIADNNTANPDAGGAGWMAVVPRVSAITTTGTITPQQAGLVQVSAASGNVTLTLPAASAAGGAAMAFTFARTDTSGNSVTVNRAGSDTIEGLASIAIPTGGRIGLVSDGVSAWRIASRVGGGNMQVFTSSDTFTVPAGVTRIKCRVWGAGGGGGGTNSGGFNAVARGGGGGGYAEGWYSVVPGQSIFVTVGAGGSPGNASPSDGGDGATTSVGSLISATGGGRGGASIGGITSAGGAFGSGVGGQFNWNGGESQNGHIVGSVLFASSGGFAYAGGYGATRSAGAAFDGSNGAAYGMGGNGGTGGLSNGGSGSQGLAIVEW